ncbi:MAG TPA: tetratricopeptide repeat protein [Allosphingosinicella sp.]|nr:tetratricopeptide repeat protein [Allosphingosinicella sp.]
MPAATPPSRRIAPATIALVLAAILAVAAVVIALVRSGDEASDNPAANASTPAAEAPTMEASITALRQRLRQDPDNDQGWFLLGLSYRGGERFTEAAQAFRRAHELAPRNADYAAYLGEALILASDGAAPPPEAEQMFRRALELQPGNAQARYYLATLTDMRGDHRGAVDALLALLREAPAGAPWEPQVREAVTAIAREHRIDIASRMPPPPTTPAPTSTAAIPGPTPDQMRAASAIPPSQQDQMVRAMVDGLAARLRQNPRDADGWIRLMRSRMVLHDAPAAGEALRSALAAFAGDAPTQARLRSAARELAVPGA